MKDILDTLIQIENTSGRNDKIKILTDLIKSYHSECHYIFKVALDPQVSTFIAKRPQPNPDECLLDNSLPFTLMDTLVLLVGGNRYKKSEWECIAHSLHNQYESEEHRRMLWKILTKDLTIGASMSTYNKALKASGMKMYKPLTAYDTVRVSNIEDAEINPQSSWVGAKKDGANATFARRFISRNGNEIPLKHLEDALFDIKDDVVLFGELVSSDRQSSSGLVNSAITKGYETDLEVSKLQFHVFDCITTLEYDEIYDPNHPRKESDLGYFARSIAASSVVEYINHPDIIFVEQHLVHSVEEVHELCDKYIDKGEEGIIWNDATMKFAITRSKKRARIKEILDGDFRIIGFKEHNKKEGHLGKFYIESICGSLTAGVGSGMLDSQRIDFWNRKKDLLGKTIKVKYNGVIPHAVKDNHFTLFLPVLDNKDIIREDKPVADSLADIDWGKKNRDKKKWMKANGIEK